MSESIGNHGAMSKLYTAFGILRFSGSLRPHKHLFRGQLISPIGCRSQDSPCRVLWTIHSFPWFRVAECQ